MLVPTSSKLVLAVIPLTGVVVAIPVYGAPTSGGDTITDFGGNDIFQISASGFGGGLEEGIALSMSALQLVYLSVMPIHSHGY